MLVVMRGVLSNAAHGHIHEFGDDLVVAVGEVEGASDRWRSRCDGGVLGVRALGEEDEERGIEVRGRGNSIKKCTVGIIE